MINGRKQYDVLIAGGGFAGLTLALQLKQSNTDISILVLERRVENAPDATHKVGESTSELSSYYLREVLQLKNYLIAHQLPKFGFRFFFSPEHKENIERRVEIGSRISNPFPTHQIDRGIFENALVKMLKDQEVDIVLGATVKQVTLSKEGHKINYIKEGLDYNCEGRWLIDSTGRRSLLKRMWGLEKESAHDVNAVWFRVACEIDIDDWSDHKTWKTYLAPGRRRLATNHLMGEGYWVWIIPLVSGCTSIGIVADPHFHPFNEFNTIEKAMKWLQKYEPVAARMLGKSKVQILDFKMIKHFAHDTERFFSADKWGLTGDAGVFLDPLYSPGTDFIALNNTWLTELIIRDIRGEDISLRSMIYERAQRELLNGWILLYQNMYGLFGKTQIMLMKIVWDWGSYWGIPALMFMNHGYANIDLLKRYSATSESIGRRFSHLNEKMQNLFKTWSQYEFEPCADRQLNTFDLDCLYQLHMGLSKKYEPDELMRQVSSNLTLLEHISTEIFRVACMHIHGTPHNMAVNPYQMSIDDTRDELLDKSKDENALHVIESIQSDIAKVWLTPLKQPRNAYAV